MIRKKAVTALGSDVEVGHVLYERRLLTLVSGLVVAGVVTWLCAMATDYWVIVVAPKPHPIAINNATERLNFVWSHSGFFRMCAIFSVPDPDPDPNPEENVVDVDGIEPAATNTDTNTNTANDVVVRLIKQAPAVQPAFQRYPADHSSPLVIRCTYHNWAGNEDDDGGPDFEEFMRAELALCLILLLLMAIGTGFSIYSLLHPRYTFKRLAAALHLMTSLSLLALLEMVRSETHLAQHELRTADVLTDSQYYFGYSYLLAWIVFIVFIVAAIAFFIGSKRRKNLPYDFEQILS